MGLRTTILVLGAVVAISGCGGGGSDTGGGGGGQVFTGTENVTIRGRGTSIAVSETLGLSISINGSAVVITNTDGSTFRGSVDANSRYTATGSALAGDIGDGVVCEPLVLNYTGSVSGNTTSGSLSGFAKCDSPVGEVVLDTSGDFTASL